MTASALQIECAPRFTGIRKKPMRNKSMKQRSDSINPMLYVSNQTATGWNIDFYVQILSSVGERSNWNWQSFVCARTFHMYMHCWHHKLSLCGECLWEAKGFQCRRLRGKEKVGFESSTPVNKAIEFHRTPDVVLRLGRLFTREIIPFSLMIWSRAHQRARKCDKYLHASHIIDSLEIDAREKHFR